jgi:hypothetical protein
LRRATEPGTRGCGSGQAPGSKVVATAEIEVNQRCRVKAGDEEERRLSSYDDG